MKNVVAALLLSALVLVGIGPLLLARYVAVRNHREQFKATGAMEFPLPTTRELEAEELKEAPGVPADRTQEIPVVVMDTSTGETVRIDADGVPLTEADLSARTPSTALTVDPDRLARILQLEETGEWPMSRETWVEVGAAEMFVRNPLTALVMPPEHLMDAAGAPTMAETFHALMDAERISYGWADGDSDFHFWTLELKESEVLEEILVS